MAGKKGMTGEALGGPRPGAGRPVRTRTLRVGQEFIGLTAGEEIQVWTVTEIARDRIVLTKADGFAVRLLNG